MKISAFKQHLRELQNLNFIAVNGALVPPHFHITEVGLITRNYVDCGGEIHKEKHANLQVWVSDDEDHRLKPATLLHIIETANPIFLGEDLEIEAEYQTETIGRYALDFKYGHFVLVAKETDCLAKCACGIAQPKPLINLAAAKNCVPGGGCC